MRGPTRLSVTVVIALFIAACGDGDRSRSAPEGSPGPARDSIWEGPGPGVYPEVWSINEPGSQSYEFKANCYGDYVTLNECALWDLTAVEVDAPDGRTFALDKDFNINEYSGEVTRRWVLYGPQHGGLPPAGQYAFRYLRNGEVMHEQAVDYQPDVVGYPTDITWRWDGDDLHVAWTPPDGMAPGMTYKVLVFPEGGNVLSLLYQWDATSAVLADLPVTNGQHATLNVAAYFDDGFAPSEYYELDYEGFSK